MSLTDLAGVSVSPRAITRGWIDAVQLPTGGYDRFPIVIAQGNPAGPTLWLTTGIHGDEHSGMIVLHRLLEHHLVADLFGTIVAVLSLNPAGIRNRSREAYYYHGDPNRRFPDPLKTSRRGCTSIDNAYALIFDLIKQSEPSALIDLHNAWFGSVPFAFRDPVFYGKYFDQQARIRTKREADALDNLNAQFIEAFGFPVINDYVAQSYLEKGLHRSLSGAALNGLNIPSMTVELGSWMFVENQIVEAALHGIRNVMRHLGMLASPVEPVEDLPLKPTSQALRRLMHPPLPAAGIVDILVEPGQAVQRFQPLAILRDLHGQFHGPRSGTIISEYDGVVLGWSHGAVRYKGEALLALAINDDSSMVVSTSA